MKRASDKGYHRATLFLARLAQMENLGYEPTEIMQLLQLAIIQGNQYAQKFLEEEIQRQAEQK